MKNIQLPVVALLLALLSGCPTFGDSSSLSSKIVGTWRSNYFDPNISYGEKTYFSDGTACGFIVDAPSDFAPAALVVFRGLWRVEGTTLVATVTEASEGAGFSVGEEIRDEIVSVDRDVLVLRDLEYDEVGMRYKVQEGREKKLCALKRITSQ